MGLECGSIKGLEGVGRDDIEGVWGVFREGEKYRRWVVGVGKEESQPISEFADDPIS